MAYSQIFIEQLNKVLDREGRVLTNTPNDRGGVTYWGISRNRWPEWIGWELIDKQTVVPPIEMVQEFYYTNFWLPVRGDEVNNDVAAEMFDTAVNQGVGQAVKCLQRSLNILNPLSMQLKDDGDFGSKTFIAYNYYFSNRHRETTNAKIVLIRCLNYFQTKTYESLCIKDHTQKANFYGWILNRVGF